MVGNSVRNWLTSRLVGTMSEALGTPPIMDFAMADLPAAVGSTKTKQSKFDHSLSSVSKTSLCISLIVSYGKNLTNCTVLPIEVHPLLF